MSRYLDTNLIGDVTKPTPSEALMAWMAEKVLIGEFGDFGDTLAYLSCRLRLPLGQPGI